MRLPSREGNGDGDATAHRHPADPLTGQCEHCRWHTIQDTYPALVKAYQDHLRDEHPAAWVRA